MNRPGFNAERSLYSKTARWQRVLKDQQEPTALVPALHTETWTPCYSRADGSVGWCGEICEDDDCYTTWD